MHVMSCVSIKTINGLIVMMWAPILKWMLLIFCRLNPFIRIKITYIHFIFNLLSVDLRVTHQHYDLPFSGTSILSKIDISQIIEWMTHMLKRS